MMAQALKEVYTLLMTLLAKEFSSENLESIFKVREEGREKREEEREREGKREGGRREKNKGKEYSILQYTTISHSAPGAMDPVQ